MDQSITQAAAGAALLGFVDPRLTALEDRLLRKRGPDAGAPLLRSHQRDPNPWIAVGAIRPGELRTAHLDHRHTRRGGRPLLIQARPEERSPTADPAVPRALPAVRR